MNRHNVNDIPKSAYMLLPIMALAFYTAFIPHQNYLYPVHVDEWVHIIYSNVMFKTGSSPFPLEIGFQLLWGVFHNISGISWITIVRYFPGIIFIITVLSVYILAQREKFGWEAALLTCLIPTTVGILGPGFLVPVALGLLFIPLALFIAFYFKNGWAYFVVSVFSFFLLSMHAPSAVCLVLILIPYVLLNLKSDLKHSLGVVLALVVPFLALLPLNFNTLLAVVQSQFTLQPLPTWIDIPQILQTYGYLPTLLCLLGVYLLAIRGGSKNYGFIFGMLALTVMLAAFFTFDFGLHTMYTRGLMYMMLMMSIIAGAGLSGLKNINIPVGIRDRLNIPPIIQNVGKFLCLAVIIPLLYIGITDRQDIPYYHMIDDEDYQAFIWIEENINESYDKAILDPWKALAFTAVTERSVYTRIIAFPTPTDEEAYKFLSGGCRDTAFLSENGISIVYSREPCSNPDLKEVRENVYLFEIEE